MKKTIVIMEIILKSWTLLILKAGALNETVRPLNQMIPENSTSILSTMIVSDCFPYEIIY